MELNGLLVLAGVRVDPGVGVSGRRVSGHQTGPDNIHHHVYT